MSDRTTRQSPSRSELLRQKRQQPLRVPVMPAKKNTPEPARQPVTNPFGKSSGNPVRPPVKQAAVVTTRNYPYSTPLRQTVNSPVRRKIYHVNGNGVETRLPSLPMIHFSWQWVSGFMTVVLVTIVLLMIYLPVFEVKQVQVVGIQRIALADVQNVVLTATDSIFTLDRQKVIKAVGLTFPELTNIDLQVDASGLLIVTVTERQPVLVWNAGSFSYWIDSEGVLMDPIGEPGSLLTINSDCGIPLITPLNYVTNVIDYANMEIGRAHV